MPDALPTLEVWADSITAVLDDLGSQDAVLLAIDGAFATGALFAATHPSRTTALVALECYADPMVERTDGIDLEEVIAAWAACGGRGEYEHVRLKSRAKSFRRQHARTVITTPQRFAMPALDDSQDSVSASCLHFPRHPSLSTHKGGLRSDIGYDVAPRSPRLPWCWRHCR
jgi:pimeloyl-ACP methyl ester carboxylesterase